MKRPVAKSDRCDAMTKEQYGHILVSYNTKIVNPFTRTFLITTFSGTSKTQKSNVLLENGWIVSNDLVGYNCCLVHFLGEKGERRMCMD